MLKEAIYHRAESNWAYPISLERLRVVLRTARRDTVQCNVVVRERYDWEAPEIVVPMERVGSDELFTYWRADIGVETRRIQYQFVIEEMPDGDSPTDNLSPVTPEGGDTVGESPVGNRARSTLWYGERSLAEDRGRAGWFQYPMIAIGDVMTVPEWAQHAVAYQIFPDRFANGDVSNDPPWVRPWAINPSPDVVIDPYASFGGDLRGIISRLPYLEDLGVNLLYLTPIFDSPSAHKYDIRDYYKIDPQFGDIDDLRELVNQAHRRGIRVILDGVFNHCGFEFGPFQHAMKHGPESPYWNWFHFHGFPVVTSPRPNYEAFAFIHLVPRLNTSNPEVIDYFTEVGLYWLRETGIDGWRLDTANEPDPIFWQTFRRRIKAEFPDALLLGEVWHDANRWLMGDKFDSVMNYPFRQAVLEFFAERSIDAAQFDERVTKLLVMYTEQAQSVNLNLIGSHDTGRFLGFCRERKEFLKLAIAFQMTFLGLPMVFYGDEIGMSSGPGFEEGRAPMIWDPSAQDRDLYAFVTRLIHLRRQHEVLRTGTFRSLVADPMHNTYIYKRSLGDRIMVVALNNSDDPARYAVDLSVDAPHPCGKSASLSAGKQLATEMLTGAEQPCEGGCLSLTLQPYDVQIWSLLMS